MECKTSISSVRQMANRCCTMKGGTATAKMMWRRRRQSLHCTKMDVVQLQLYTKQIQYICQGLYCQRVDPVETEQVLQGLHNNSHCSLTLNHRNQQADASDIATLFEHHSSLGTGSKVCLHLFASVCICSLAAVPIVWATSANPDLAQGMRRCSDQPGLLSVP